MIKDCIKWISFYLTLSRSLKLRLFPKDKIKQKLFFGIWAIWKRSVSCFDSRSLKKHYLNNFNILNKIINFFSTYKSLLPLHVECKQWTPIYVLWQQNGCHPKGWSSFLWSSLRWRTHNIIGNFYIVTFFLVPALLRDCSLIKLPIFDGN